MVGDHVVVQVGVGELQPRHEQLGPDDHGHGAAQEQHHQREYQVHRTYILVVGAVEPAPESLRRAVMVIVVGGVGVTHALILQVTIGRP